MGFGVTLVRATAIGYDLNVWSCTSQRAFTFPWSSGRFFAIFKVRSQTLKKNIKEKHYIKEKHVRLMIQMTKHMGL